MTLAWDPSPGSDIAGYRLYQGTASRKYSTVIPVGNATRHTVSGLVSGTTYFFAVTAYATSGLESDYSTEISYTIAAAASTDSASPLTFAADSGTISTPFAASNGMVSQPNETSLANGGRAVYRFDIPQAGGYIVSAMVIAANEGQNSLYVNIDADPTDPLMIWDIPVCATLTCQTVCWRGTSSAVPGTSQYSPKVFILSAGTHQLIVRGREANTRLGTISIVGAPPRLQIATGYGGAIIVSGTGQPGQTYHLLRSQDLRSWAVIGDVTLDPSGYFEYWDFARMLSSVSVYRLQRVTVTPPRLQIRVPLAGPVVLDATGETGQTYNVMRSQDLKTWTAIGTLMLDASGWGQFTDPAGSGRPRCVYRLQGQ